MADGLGVWEPLAVGEAAALFAGAAFPWWIAGGWALDLFIGRQTRTHGDMDVLVLRRDQLAAREVLNGWDVHAADPPGSLRPWALGEVLPPAAHDIWCRRTASSPWSLQLMLNDSDETGERWIFRRDARIGGPTSELGRVSNDGVPYLTPEVQLLYKAKGRRPKDEADLETVLPLLAPTQALWLARALETWQPGHPWLSRIAAVRPTTR